MLYSVVDSVIDEAGKYRVRVDINGNTVMFKYDEQPDDAQIQADAISYVEFQSRPPQVIAEG